MKLLQGSYTGDTSELGKKMLRQNLGAQLKLQKKGLRRTETKESMGTAKPGDIARLAEVYTKSNGNLKRLVLLCGCQLDLLEANPPTSAEDFAQKLLQGVYTK